MRAAADIAVMTYVRRHTVRMETPDIVARCAEHRRALADLVESLDDAQLATPSLCGKWDVRTVAAHLTVLPLVPPQKFAIALLKNRGSFHRANDAVARQLAAAPVTGIAADLRTHAESRKRPPRVGPVAPLADLLIHGGDIRIPLGIAFAPPAADLEVVLDFLAAAPYGFVPKGLLSGLSLQPTDLHRRWGEGEPVTGRAADIMMAITGRRATLSALGGPGRDRLAARL
jgi:uncharacterized protein (TIGR03083 family)